MIYCWSSLVFKKFFCTLLNIIEFILSILNLYGIRAHLNSNKYRYICSSFCFFPGSSIMVTQNTSVIVVDNTTYLVQFNQGSQLPKKVTGPSNSVIWKDQVESLMLGLDLVLFRKKKKNYCFWDLFRVAIYFFEKNPKKNWAFKRFEQKINWKHWKGGSGIHKYILGKFLRHLKYSLNRDYPKTNLFGKKF